MLAVQTTAENSSTTVSTKPFGGISNVPWYVTGVQVLGDFELAVEFIDGTAGTVKMKGLIFREDAGVFAALRDPDVFSAVSAEDGDLLWANGLDLAPDAMYDEFCDDGVWVL